MLVRMPRTRLLVSLLALLGARPARADVDACVTAHTETQEARLRGALRSARDQALRCVQTSCPALVRSDCASWLNELEASLPSMVFVVRDGLGHDIPDAELDIDGVARGRADGRPVELDPGVVRVRVAAQGHAAKVLSLIAAEGERRRLVMVTLADAAPSVEAARAKPWLWSGGLLVGAGVLTASGRALARARAMELRDCSDAQQCATRDARLDRLERVGNGLAIGGAAVAALGLAALVRGLWLPRGQPSLELSLSPHTTGLMWTAHGHF
jgi:hypothetical protein